MEITPLRSPVPGLRLLRVIVDRPDRRTLGLLAPEERVKADGFARIEDRHRYIAGRAALRTVLGWAGGVRPEAIQLRVSAMGRPHLRANRGPRLDFNLSHSGDLALFALWRGPGQVGIDVEHESSTSDHVALARVMFPPTEAEAVADAPEADRVMVFLRQWTIREAYVKALGTGLARFRDVVVERTTVRLGEVPHRRGRFWPLELGAGCAAAVALCPAPYGKTMQRKAGHGHQ